jgi:polysaccharide biosynthesis protein PslG
MIAFALVFCVLSWAATAGEAAAKKSPPAKKKTPAKKKAPAATSALLGGVNIVGIDAGAPLSAADQAIANAHALHAKVVRTEVPWAQFEPDDAAHINPATQAFADRLVGDAAADGIRVIMTVDTTPCWASSAPPSVLQGCGQDDNNANAWPPTNPADYAAFVSYLAARYGNALAAIEVWNEPDQANQAYFAGPNKPEHYAAVLRAAYPAIKAVDPKIAVLAGSLVGPNGGFLRELYEHGIEGFYDGLAVHYYTLTLAAVRTIHEVQLENGDHTPLWLDEFGWTSCWPQLIEQEQGCVTAQTQAMNLSNTVRALARSPFVAAAVAYKLQDSHSEEFGLTTPAGARKPAFSAFGSALNSPLGAISSITLGLKKKGTSVIASGSAPVGDYMRMEVFHGKLLRYHALFTLDRFNHYLITLPSALGTRGLRVRVYQYWAGPGKAVSKTI